MSVLWSYVGGVPVYVSALVLCGRCACLCQGSGPMWEVCLTMSGLWSYVGGVPVYVSCVTCDKFTISY